MDVTRSTANDPSNQSKVNPSRSSFLIAKWSILRFLGFVYFVAFLGASFQNPGLIGSDGLLPATEHMERLRSSLPPDNKSPLVGFFQNPTIFWFVSSPLTDTHMEAVTTTGLVLSAFVLFGLNSWLAMFLLYILDFSIVTVAEGTSFYSYGWESQLLETGFLSIFLCDLPRIDISHEGKWCLRCLWKDDVEQKSAPSSSALYLMRWLMFRISLGAGLIKIRGSSCWTEKTCLHYHFETQPIPSPTSFIFHFLPKTLLSRAVDLDLFVQLYTSWMVLLPETTWWMRNMRRLGGWIQVGFMMNIILSGNFAFLNHLTIIPGLSCLDDACWPHALRQFVVGKKSEKKSIMWKPALYTRKILDFTLMALIGWLSLPVIANLTQWGGKSQQMNASFNPFRLVNTYGAFGSVGEARYEPIVSISANGETWHEIEFPCKPGKLTRRPCFCAPYHYRLDWNIWFLGFKPHGSMLRQRESWLFVLLTKILDDDDGPRPWMNLLDQTAVEHVPPLAKERPRFAKVDMYRYTMAAPLWDLLPQWILGNTVVWWQREFEEGLIPPVIFDPVGKELRLP